MTLNSEPSRANEIWKRFAGMFGADALERKFGKSPPPEWQVMLGRLKDFEIDRGVRRLAYSGKQHVPTLPEFTRMCRELGGEYPDAPVRPALPNPATFTGDDWDIVGNLRLAKHITTILARTPTALGPVGTRVQDPNTKIWQVNPSKEQAITTEVLLEHKRAWSQEMREYVDTATGEIGRPPMAFQNQVWDGVMDSAMLAIAQRIMS